MSNLVKFVKFATKSKFNLELSEIAYGSIIFIEETKEIYLKWENSDQRFYGGTVPKVKFEDNKLQLSHDDILWTPKSDYIAAWFRVGNNKLQINRTGNLENEADWVPIDGSSTEDFIYAKFKWHGTDKSGKIQINRYNDNNPAHWEDLSPEFTNNLAIKDVVKLLPDTCLEGDLYLLGPDSDNKYHLKLRADSLWKDAGEFTQVVTNLVQTTGTSTYDAMSLAAVTAELQKRPVISSSENSITFNVDTILGDVIDNALDKKIYINDLLIFNPDNHIKVINITEDDYDALEIKDPNVYYFILEEE